MVSVMAKSGNGDLSRSSLNSLARRAASKSGRLLLSWADGNGSAPGDPVVHRGFPMPPRSLRNHMCGEIFLSDDFYFQSCVVEATRLTAQLGYRPGSKVLDVGCGLGRLATGMIAQFGERANYLGLEPNRDFYEWCSSTIEPAHPSYQFVHVDIASELYNPDGTIDGATLSLPVPDSSIDIVYCWGVFTNAIEEHVSRYISEFQRVVATDGRIFLTAFVEEQDAVVDFNPDEYVPFDCVVPLNVVRYSMNWMFELFDRHGLRVEDFRYHGGMFPMQSEITLSPSDPPGRLS